MMKKLLNKFKLFYKSIFSKNRDKDKDTNVSNNENKNDGWVRLTIDSVFSVPSVNEIYQHVIDSGSWRINLQTDMLSNIKVWSPNDVLRITLMERFSNFTKIELYRWITVSSIYYEFPIPKLIFTFDDTTLNQLLNYICITEVVHLDITDLVPDTEGKTVILNDIKSYLDLLVINPAFKITIDDYVINGYKRLPNIVSLFTTIRVNCTNGNKIRNLDIYQFKKLLTCYFLGCKIALPRNYIYIDMDVIDFVNCAGEYEVSK